MSCLIYLRNFQVEISSLYNLYPLHHLGTKDIEGEMDKINSYPYPKINSKGNEFEFTIDSHHIKIKAEDDKAEERVLVLVDNNLFSTLRNNEADVKDTIELFNHKVFIHYRLRSKSNAVWDAFRDALFLVNEGLFITIDGKPLEDSIADPAIRIKTASFGYYILAGLMLMSIFAYKEMPVVILAIVGITITFGLLTKKVPMFFLPLGVIWGALELFGVFASMSNSSYKVPSGAGFLVLAFFILLRIGVVLNFVLGIIAAIKIRTLRSWKSENEWGK